MASGQRMGRPMSRTTRRCRRGSERLCLTDLTGGVGLGRGRRAPVRPGGEGTRGRFWAQRRAEGPIGILRALQMG